MNLNNEQTTEKKRWFFCSFSFACRESGAKIVQSEKYRQCLPNDQCSRNASRWNSLRFFSSLAIVLCSVSVAPICCENSVTETFKFGWLKKGHARKTAFLLVRSRIDCSCCAGFFLRLQLIVEMETNVSISQCCTIDDKEWPFQLTLNRSTFYLLA